MATWRELSFQPCPGHAPVALYGALGDFEDQGNFGKGETAKEMQFDDSGLARVELRQALEGLIQDEHVDGPLLGPLLRRKKRVVQGDLTQHSAPLASLPCAGVVHEDMPH